MGASFTPQHIDEALRGLAQRRAGLDVEELLWLRLAQQQNAWSEIGYVHAHEYLEDVFGYSPRTATERLRVAYDLGEMPELEVALEAGELNYSQVKELTRVATPDTVDRWLEAARGRNLREVERMVSGRRKGDGPETAPDPKLVKHRVSLDLDGESFAIYRQARAALDDELGERLDDKCFMMEVAQRLLAGIAVSPESANVCDENAGDENANGDDAQAAPCPCGATGNGAVTKSYAPSYVVHVAKCPGCRRAWQDGAGVRVELEPSALERIECDAIIVDEDGGKRARSVMPPSTRRAALSRAEHRCEVPGCRSSQNLDVHHIWHQADGGGHELWNLVVLCGGHHRLHHDGLLSISGRAPDAVVFKRGRRRLVAAPTPVPPTSRSIASRAGSRSNVRSNAAVTHHRDSDDATSPHAADAKKALTQMGYKAGVAKRAVEVACAHVGATTDLPTLIRVALRHCV